MLQNKYFIFEFHSVIILEAFPVDYDTTSYAFHQAQNNFCNHFGKKLVIKHLPHSTL